MWWQGFRALSQSVVGFLDARPGCEALVNMVVSQAERVCAERV